MVCTPCYTVHDSGKVGLWPFSTDRRSSRRPPQAQPPSFQSRRPRGPWKRHLQRLATSRFQSPKQLKSFTESMGSAATAKSAENRIAVAEGTGINSTFQTIPSLALSINDGLRVRARKPKSCSSWQTVDCEVQVITVGATAVISGISEHVSEHPTPPGTFHWLPRGS